MRITRIVCRHERFPLTRPYTIAYATTDAVDNWVVQLHAEGGLVGWGAAAPSEHVTGESEAACAEALDPATLDWLTGRDVRTLPLLARELRRRLPATPAARAALDMALHDLLARRLGLPLVALLGQAHQRLATSITIGIKPVADALAEADEYLGRGFRILKVKLGLSLAEDLERLARLRERVGPDVVIRVDPNQGYSAAEVERFVDAAGKLAIEFLEQPMAADRIDELRALPEPVRRRIAADESLLDEHDALRLLTPEPACGIFNIKLMKCGGIWAANRIATVAETAGIELMWGCMDESIISISAALHAALASPATRYLDLDGSLDLARDVVSGGFVLRDGYLSPTAAPGLGVAALD